MRVKGIDETLGKTITGIIVKENKTMFQSPSSQVFLLFSDHTYYELYTGNDTISFSGGVDKGDKDTVAGYMSQEMNIAFEAYLNEQK